LETPSAEASPIDGPAFIQRVEAHLNPVAPIMAFVIKKQMTDLNATPDSLTPQVARTFIDRLVAVLRTFAPAAKVEEIRQTLLREFRRAAPQYADQLMYGGKG